MGTKATRKSPTQLAIDSIDSVLRLSVNRCSVRRGLSDANRAAWSAVSIEAIKALLQASANPSIANSVSKEHLQEVAANLKMLADEANARSRSTSGVPNQKRSALLLSKQRWAGIAVSAYTTYFDVLRALEQETTDP